MLKIQSETHENMSWKQNQLMGTLPNSPIISSAARSSTVPATWKSRESKGTHPSAVPPWKKALLGDHGGYIIL